MCGSRSNSEYIFVNWPSQRCILWEITLAKVLYFFRGPRRGHIFAIIGGEERLHRRQTDDRQQTNFPVHTYSILVFKLYLSMQYHWFATQKKFKIGDYTILSN